VQILLHEIAHYVQCISYDFFDGPWPDQAHQHNLTWLEICSSLYKEYFGTKKAHFLTLCATQRYAAPLAEHEDHNSHNPQDFVLYLEKNFPEYRDCEMWTEYEMIQDKIFDDALSDLIFDDALKDLVDSTGKIS
jgi:hypothetical protein